MVCLLAVLTFLDVQGIKPEPLLKTIAGYHREISTSSFKAKEYVEQGIVLYYSYHYRQARRSFQEAVKADPECAMAYWGEAATYGPDINRPEVSTESAKNALKALSLARKAKAVSTLEKQLIEAEALRFTDPSPTKRDNLNHAYTVAMKAIWQENQKDPDIGALYAEATIDEKPWNQWQPDGSPNEGTVEAIKVLKAVLKINPMHPMGLHMMIHATEASRHPENGLEAADKLFGLLPEVAHMQHMPCHIYARLGQWQNAINANISAISLENTYMTALGLDARKFPNVDHYGAALAYAAGMAGQSKVALSAIDIEGFTSEVLQKDFKDYDGDLAMPLMVAQQFGKWDKILATPSFGKDLPISEAMRFGSRAVALAANDKLDEAKSERNKMLNVLKSIPGDKKYSFDNIHDVLAVESHITAGEILIREVGHEDEGIAELKKAVAAEDGLHYSEPPTWLMPTRHALGAALLKTYQYKEAQRVFEENLVKNPNDGWAMMGLSKAFKGLKKEALSRKALTKFKKLWKYADIDITTSCMCLETHPKG